MKVLVLGADGYTGSHLVPELIAAGHSVRGLVRDMERSSALEKLGMELRVGDVAKADDVANIAVEQEVIINLVGYCRAAPRSMRRALVDGTRNLMRVIDRGACIRYVWASNLAVYGHPGSGTRLDERSPLRPVNDLGRATLQIEQLTRAQLPAVTVRVSTVYGPGRDHVDAVAEGRIRLLNGGENYQSRIHVRDLVQVLVAAMSRAPVGETYVACDDLPTTVRDFYFELAEALHVPPPLPLEVNAARAFTVATRAFNWLSAQEQYGLNENVIGLLTGNYSCVNSKMKQELGVELHYPTFREGYEELLTGSRGGKQG
jgi:nucleoside-diphosphate-sugar epimerase